LKPANRAERCGSCARPARNIHVDHALVPGGEAETTLREGHRTDGPSASGLETCIARRVAKLTAALGNPFRQVPRHALAVDRPTGQVWFTTYDGVSPPAVAVLTPSTGMIRSWTLPAAIAVPANHIDGIVVTRASGILLVYVAIPERNELLEIDPVALTARVWPLRYGSA
jgi:hypothetical protein